MGTRSWLARIGLVVTCAAAMAPAGSSASASTTPATSTLGLVYGARAPGATTSMRIQIVYRKPSDPNGKPSPIRHLLIQAPTGTTFNLHRVQPCMATDTELETVGRAACPAHSRIGAGTIMVDTGLGPPVDPFQGDVVIYNDGQGWIETVTDHGTSYPVVAVDRVTIHGDELTASPPFEPGAPPDGSAVRRIDFGFPAATGYITTPPHCAPDRAWTTHARFGFADGTTQTATNTTPCSPGHRAIEWHHLRLIAGWLS